MRICLHTSIRVSARVSCHGVRMVIRALLADNDPQARHNLREMLQAQPGLEVAGETAVGPETLDLIRSAKPDLLFIDMPAHAPKTSGLRDQISSDPNLRPTIILTGADEFSASRNSDLHPVDCLVKPFTAERLRSAIDHAREHIEADPGPRPAASRNQLVPGYTNRIVLRSRGRIQFIPVAAIRWIAAEENYVRICSDTESHLLREPISRLEARLDPQKFRRIHRSSIVNLECVKEVRTESNGESVVILSNGQRLAMSRSYRSRMNQWLMSS